MAAGLAVAGSATSTAAAGPSGDAKVFITPTQDSFAVCTTATFVAEADDASDNGVAGETVTFTVTARTMPAVRRRLERQRVVQLHRYRHRHGHGHRDRPGIRAVRYGEGDLDRNSGCGPDVALSKIAGGSIVAGTQPSVAWPIRTASNSGLRFSSSTPLAIEGVRFFKGAGNAGTTSWRGR